jgi:hypothetical protein
MAARQDHLAAVQPAAHGLRMVLPFIALGGLAFVLGCESPGTTAVTGGGSPTVATVTVSPANDSVTVGSTAQLIATPRDANGNPLVGVAVSWTSKNTAVATVSSSGLVSGVAAGADSITATANGRSASALVTVTSAAAGGTVLISEPFADTALGSRGWYDNTAVAIDTSQHLAGGQASLLAHFLPGAAQPTWGGGFRHLMSPTGTLYVSFWIKHSASWVGSEQTSHPHLMFVLSTADVTKLGIYSGLAANYLDIGIEENYPSSTAGGSYGRVVTQDALNINTALGAVPDNLVGTTESRDVSGCNGTPDSVPTFCYADTGTPSGYNDTKLIQCPSLTFTDASKTGWHQVEVYLAMNSITSGKANFDGIVRYWLDGVLQMEHTNVQFRTGANATMQWQEFAVGPYIGVGSPVDQSLWVASLVVATAHP